MYQTYTDKIGPGQPLFFPRFLLAAGFAFARDFAGNALHSQWPCPGPTLLPFHDIRINEWQYQYFNNDLVVRYLRRTLEDSDLLNYAELSMVPHG